MHNQATHPIKAGRRANAVYNDFRKVMVVILEHDNLCHTGIVSNGTAGLDRLGINVGQGRQSTLDLCHSRFLA